MPKFHPWRYSSQNPDDVIMGYTSNNNKNNEDEYTQIKKELATKTVKELHAYFESIGGTEDELKGKKKEQIIKHIVKFAKMVAGENNNNNNNSKGGAKKLRKTRKTRKFD
jgi:hypothetical protein